ncbi:MAG TPA: hypothetical protein VF622_14795 [Segetibacter sp.]|jgi:hypothetical protein
MKKKSAIVLTLILVIFSSFHKEPENTETYSGRVAVKGPCGQIVVSIISPNAGKANVDSWKDPVTKKQYKNVFTVQNFCTFSKLNEGDIFRFKVVKRLSSCNACLAYRPVPATRKYIQIAPEEPVEISK